MIEDIKKVEAFMEELFAKQKRCNGDSYFHTHLLGVRDIAKKIAEPLIGPGSMDVIEIVALAHDAAEDQELTEDEFGEWLKQNTLQGPINISLIVTNLKLLNKNYAENYLDFVLRAQSSGASLIVKIADITHNLQNLKPGSMRDKYLLAKHILEQYD